MGGLKKGLLLGLAAILAGGGGAYLAQQYIHSRIAQKKAEIESRYEPRKVVVATRNVPAGTQLSTNLVASREVPKTYLHADAVAASQWSAVAGGTLSRPVNQGEPILNSHLNLSSGAEFADRLPEGMRALTIPVDAESSISGMLSPDDHVDLMVTLSSEDGESTFPLLRDIRVVATGARTGNRPKRAQRESGGGSRYRNVTVAVSPEDAARITHARNVGDVHVTLRPTGEGEINPGYRITKAQLLGETPGEEYESAEVIVGGE